MSGILSNYALRELGKLSEYFDDDSGKAMAFHHGVGAGVVAAAQATEGADLVNVIEQARKLPADNPVEEYTKTTEEFILGAAVGAYIHRRETAL